MTRPANHADNDDTPLTPEERAIWRALWRIPSFRTHHGFRPLGTPTQKEIAAFLGITPQAVSDIERRALIKIKLALIIKK